MHRQIGGEARRVCMHVYVRCVRVCVSSTGVGERARLDSRGRERRMDEADRRAIDSRETPHRPGLLTDGGPAPRLAGEKERAWPALPTDGTLRWIGWTEERNTERKQERKWPTQIRGLYLWNHLCFVYRMRGCYQVMVTMVITVTSFVSLHCLCNQMRTRGIFIYEHIKGIFWVIYNLNVYGQHLWL